MTNAIGGLGTTGVSANLSAPVVAPTALSTASTIPTALTTSTKAAVNPARIVFDPSAGVVSQFLDTNGNLESQIPSIAAVAYLRAGLTSDGLSKKAAEPVTQTAVA